MATPGRHRPKRKRKKASKYSRDTSSDREEEEDAVLGCLVVHGIGKYDTGDGFLALAQPVLREASILGCKLTALSAESTPSGLTLQPYRFESGRRSKSIVFAEGNWSDTVDEIRDRNRIRAGLRFYIWLLRSLPLLLQVVGPDFRDMRRPTRPGSADFVAELPTVWRIVTAIFWITSIGGSISWVTQHLSSGVALAVVAVLVVALVFAASLRSNLAEYVRVASVSANSRRKLVRRVDSALSELESRCDEVIVIAHSQGGYLAYHVIRARHENGRAQQIRGLYAIGSGLRPITMLSELGGGQRALQAWFGLSGATMVLFASWPVLDAFLRDSGEMIARLLHFFAEFASLPLIAAVEALQFMPDLIGWGDVVSGPRAAWHALLDLGTHRVALSAIGVGLWIAAFWMMRKAPALDRISLIPTGNFEWCEYSSAHDVVGRMVTPEFPDGVDQPSIPSPGNPFRDHTLASYMGESSPLPTFLAIRILNIGRSKLAPTDAIHRTEKWRTIQERLTTRIYWLRAIVSFETIGVAAALQLFRGNFAFYSVLAWSAFLLPFIVVSHVIFYGVTAHRLLQTRKSFITGDAGRVPSFGCRQPFPENSMLPNRASAAHWIGSIGLLVFLSGPTGIVTMHAIQVPVDNTSSGAITLCGLLLLAATPAVAMNYRISWWFIGGLTIYATCALAQATHSPGALGFLWTTQYALAWAFVFVGVASLCLLRLPVASRARDWTTSIHRSLKARS